MNKFFIVLLTVMMLALVLTGCGPAPSDDTQQSADVSQSASDGESAPVTETAQTSLNAGLGTPADSYTAFLIAKSAVFARLKDALSQSEPTKLTYMTFLDIAAADLLMFPAKYFGTSEDAAAAGLATFNASDVIYSENGSTYMITYKDKQGAAYVFSGTYDAAADALACTAQKNGKDYFYSEYRRTSYGYVSQYFFINDDGTTSLYQFTVSGEDGALGYSATQTSQPAALTGSEAADFPTALPEWYSITGSAIEGVMSDGTEVNFEYVPTPSE